MPLQRGYFPEQSQDPFRRSGERRGAARWIPILQDVRSAYSIQPVRGYLGLQAHSAQALKHKMRPAVRQRIVLDDVPQAADRIDQRTPLIVRFVSRLEQYH